MNVWFISNYDAAFATFVAQFLRKDNHEKDKLKDPCNISSPLKDRTPGETLSQKAHS